jgi:surfactin synthase thioesterase subunit
MAVSWFYVPQARPWHALKLVCLPYAGAPAAAYREWGALVPEHVEVHAIQLPGRGWRMRETPLDSIKQMGEQVAAAVYALDGPLALFGHSMGSWLGLEVARRLQELGRVPQMLIASGRQAPALGPKLEPMSHFDDDLFVETVQRRYGGIPAQILADREMMALLLPALRADVRALEEYAHEPSSPVECPLVALGGRDDPLVTRDDLEAWREETSAAFGLRTFAGGHFYFTDRTAGFFDFLAEELKATAASANPSVR